MLNVFGCHLSFVVCSDLISILFCRAPLAFISFVTVIYTLVSSQIKTSILLFANVGNIFVENKMGKRACICIVFYSHDDTFTWVKNVFRINPEFRILRLTFHRKSASKC